MVRCRGGFTLVEVMVALVVLEMGLLGVVGTLVLAGRTTVRASVLERGVAAAEAVMDSLARSSDVGAGSAPTGGGGVSWHADEGGRVEVVFRPASGVGPLRLVTHRMVEGGV